MTSSERPPVGPGRRGYVASAAALAVALLLAGAATACGGDANAERDPRPPGATTVERGPRVTGFEAGEVPEGADSASIALTSGAARSGARGLEVRARGGDAYLRWDTAALGGEQPYWSFRAWVRIVDWTPGESVDLFTVRNREATNNFDLFVGAPWRRFQWDLYREDSGEVAGPVAPGEWHLVEAKGSFAGATSTAEVRIDGVDQPPIASSGQVPSVAREFVLGSIGTDKTNTTHFDDVAIALGDAPLPFLGAPVVLSPGAGGTAASGVQP
jgi:hypothetical protein